MGLRNILLVIFLAGSCNLLGPDEYPELEPGRRDYIWTVDTLDNGPSGWFDDIWGSSPDNVYAVSKGGVHYLWHFDGSEWAPYTPRFVGDFYSIFGFAQNDVWMGGGGPGGRGIWHFDGQEWKLAHTYQPEGMGEPNIKDIWGTSSSDLYAVGSVPTGLKNPAYRGFILHYDGKKWEEVLMTDFGMQFQRIRKDKEGIYVYGSGPYSTQTISDSISFYKLRNSTLHELYSEKRSRAGSPGMNKIDDKIYFVVENEITDTKFNSILSLKYTQGVFGIDGRQEKDLFIISAFSVTHYNGEDTQGLFHLDNQNANLWSSLVLEKEVFFLINDYELGTNLIYHGTLPEEEQEE